MAEGGQWDPFSVTDCRNESLTGGVGVERYRSKSTVALGPRRPLHLESSLVGPTTQGLTGRGEGTGRVCGLAESNSIP